MTKTIEDKKYKNLDQYFDACDVPMWIRLKVEIAVWSWLAQKNIDVMGNIINETKT